MTGGDVSKASYIIDRCIRNEKAPLDTGSRVEKAECLKVYLWKEKDNCKMII